MRAVFLLELYYGVRTIRSFVTCLMLTNYPYRAIMQKAFINSLEANGLFDRPLIKKTYLYFAHARDRIVKGKSISLMPGVYIV